VTTPINHVSTGSTCIDQALEGGIAQGTITLIYGEAETGKSTLAIQIAANTALQGKKVLFVDCDNTFHAERLQQITMLRFNQAAEQINLIKPKDFTEQTVLIDHLQNYLTKNFGLIVIDTLTNLYRAKVSETAPHKTKTFNLSRELNRQLAILAQTAKIQSIPIVVTSQVKSVLNEPTVSIAPVATRVQQFWADTIIKLELIEDSPAAIQATLEKTPNHNTQKPTCTLNITQTGIHDA
jgi:DNA repair protein RadB